MAHVGCQIGGADENPVNAVDFKDIIKVFQTFNAFNLHQQANFGVSSGAVIGDLRKARGAGQGIAYTAITQRRVGNISNELAGLIRIINHRYQDGLCACIEYLFD